MKTLTVEIADTPYSQEKGLMFRKSLNNNNGMLFKFSSPKTLKFWGLNTYIPLDIAFINNNKIINIERIKPLSMKTVESKVPCSVAIEVNEGYFNHHNISEGDVVSFHGKSVIFRKNEKTAQIENSLLVNNENDLPVIDSGDISKYDVENPDYEEELINKDQEQKQDEIPKKDYPQFPNQLAALKFAKDNLEVVRIKYITKKGVQLVRDVEPHGDFFSDSTHKSILVVYDETIQGIRSFIIENIIEYSFLNRKFNKKFIVRQ
jgi:uncharacterized membrane protein (UPF0127 family)